MTWRRKVSHHLFADDTWIDVLFSITKTLKHFEYDLSVQILSGRLYIKVQFDTSLYHDTTVVFS